MGLTPETEEIQVPITVPKTNIDAMIAQAVVDSKISTLIEQEISKALSSYQLSSMIGDIIKQVIRGEISSFLNLPYLDDERNPGHGDENHPARRLKAAIVAEVDKVLNEEDNLSKLVTTALSGQFRSY